MDRIVTKTMAELYLHQGHLQEAYEMFKTLLEKDPADIEIQRRVSELSEKLAISPSVVNQPVPSPDEKIRVLQRWLTTLQRRKRR